MQVLVQQANHCVWHIDLFHWYVQGHFCSFFSKSIFFFRCITCRLCHSPPSLKNPVLVLWEDEFLHYKKWLEASLASIPLPEWLWNTWGMEWVHRVCPGGPWRPFPVLVTVTECSHGSARTFCSSSVCHGPIRSVQGCTLPASVLSLQPKLILCRVLELTDLSRILSLPLSRLGVSHLALVWCSPKQVTTAVLLWQAQPISKSLSRARLLESRCNADPRPLLSALVQPCCSLSFPLVTPDTTGEKQHLQQMPHLLLCQYLVFFL